MNGVRDSRPPWRSSIFAPFIDANPVFHYTRDLKTITVMLPEGVAQWLQVWIVEDERSDVR